MGLDSLIRSAVSIADSVTASLQVEVSLLRWVSQGRTGVPVYADALTVDALVEPNRRVTRQRDGTEMVLTNRITILRTVSLLTGAFEPGAFSSGFQTGEGRSEPIDPRDKVVMPDGNTCPIASIDGVLLDPSTGAPYMFQLTLTR